MANFQQGSLWRKWDLHVHTPSSIIQNYGGNTDDAWNAFVQAIANLPPEMKVIGINDYLFCDGYEKLLSRRAEIPNIELIIPNIEFRLNTFSGTANNAKRHNFHVLFDPSIDPRDIREQFLGSLSSGYKIQDGEEWQQTPTVRSLEQLGRQIKSAAPVDNTVQNKSDLEVGFDSITYRKEDILKLLEKDCFKGKFLTAIGYSEWDQSRWDQSAAEKRTLINDADFCLTSNDDPDKIAANRKDLADNKLNSLVLHSSDAHSLDRIGKTLLWLKADPTFGDLTKERDAFLTELLKKNVRFARAIDSFNAFVGENDLKIQSGIQDLTAASRNLKESTDQLKKLGSLKEIEAEIGKKNTEMQKYKGSDLSEEELVRYAKANKEFDENTKGLDILNQDKKILSALTAQDVSVFVSENDLSPLSPTRRELIREGLRKKGREALTELVTAQLKEIEAQIKERNLAMVTHQKTIDELKDKVAKNKTVTDLSKELLDLENTKTTISQHTEKRDRARADYDRAMTLLVAANTEFKQRQSAIYGSIELDSEFKFVNISISTKYDIEQLKDFVDHNINTRDSIEKTDSDVEILFSQDPVEPSPDVVQKIISFLMDGNLKIKTAAGDIATALGQLLKNRYIIDYPNSVKSSGGEVYFKDMTGGQKAITFLELIFSLSDEKYPILIDQPEDDLDVGGVADDLVTFVIREKIQRQIIVVSHNATLVVCSDSEEIITSTMRRRTAGQYDFDYATGSIENPARRDEIISILEGGREALKKRMKKLRIG